MTLFPQPFGTLPDGRTAHLHRLAHRDGIEVVCSTYGATMVALTAPTRTGERTHLLLGYDNLEAYQRQTHYCGAIVGRYANRIREGKITLNGNAYQLTPNTPPHHLHGGRNGFDRRLWTVSEATPTALTLTYSSPNGEEGYPGTLAVTARYSLPDPFTLQLDLAADSDQPTVVNLTAHPYFNLAGHGDILRHLLMIPATHFTPVGAGLIPTGEIASVADTPLDFRTPTAIGARIHETHPQLVYGSGYDHNYVLKHANTPALQHMAQLTDPDSGRMMDVYATHPGVQVYSCNFLNNTPNGRGGAEYAPHSGIALEPQAFPDSPNQPLFPSTLVTPDHPYRQTILYQFTIP